MIKNVTLTLEEGVLEKIRAKAAAQHKTLNHLFREWAAQYVGVGRNRSEQYQALMKKIGYNRINRKLTRDEMNER